MKKIISCLLALIMIVSCVPTFALADDSLAKETIVNGEMKASSTFVVNEYAYIERIKHMTLAEAVAEGLSETDWKEFKEFDYKAVLIERAKLSNETLLNYGYSMLEITELKKLLKNANYPINMYDLSSEITISIIQNSYTSKTRKFTASFSWSKMPAHYGEDYFGVTWVGVNPQGGKVDLVVDYSSGWVNYVKMNTWKYSKTTYPTVLQDTNFRYFKFNLGNSVSDTWAKSGSICLTLKLDANATLNYAKVLVGYGHRALKVSSGTFSVGTSGLDVSINISGGLDGYKKEYQLKGKGGVVATK